MNNFVFDPDAHEGHVDNKIVFALERLSHVFRIHWWDENKKFQVSPLQMQILITLRFQPYLDSVSTIAGYLELSRATVSDAVRVLDRKGYVHKHPDSEDGRRHHITLTEIGIHAAEELSLFANQIRDFVKTSPNRGIFLESLLLLMGRLQENGFIPPLRMCTTCRHFQRTESAPTPYFCQFLNKPLATDDLRIHCFDHEEVL